MAQPDLTIASISVYKVATPFGVEVQYEAGAAVDGDGAPTCYALPKDVAALGLKPLDNIKNAGGPGNWFGVVTDTGDKTGEPIKQTDGPYKGYLLSATALVDRNYPSDDYRRYVDSRVIPYISIPPQLRSLGAHEGDGALVADRDTGKSVQCVVADIGPRKKLGEASIACAVALGYPSSPRNGGVGKGIIVRIFVGSAGRWADGVGAAWSFSRSVADVAGLVDARASLT